MTCQKRTMKRVSGWMVAVVAAGLLGAAEAQLPQLETFNTNASNAGGKVPEYDVVSIKVHKPAENMMRMMMRPDGFQMDNVTAKNLVANAYGLRSDLVSGGPGWMSSTGYDIEAKVSGADVDQYRKLNAVQRRTMLQAVLADRFQLKTHMETKELPIYELVIAKGGPKMEVADVPPAPVAGAPGMPPGAGPRMQITMGPDRLEVSGANMGMLVNQLSSTLKTTVVDKTGLTGRYNMKLHWTPENAPAQADNGSGDAPPSIFTAVQEQLGLKLQPAKGPVETVVVDRAEAPSVN